MCPDPPVTPKLCTVGRLTFNYSFLLSRHSVVPPLRTSVIVSLQDCSCSLLFLTSGLSFSFLSSSVSFSSSHTLLKCPNGPRPSLGQLSPHRPSSLFTNGDGTVVPHLPLTPTSTISSHPLFSVCSPLY